MAPAVTLQLTVIPIAVSPMAVKPTALKSFVWLGRRVTLFGESCMRATALGLLGPTTLISCPMQAASAAAEARRAWRRIRARRLESLKVKGIVPPLRLAGRHGEVVHPHGLVDGRPRANVGHDQELLELYGGMRARAIENVVPVHHKRAVEPVLHDPVRLALSVGN